MCAIEEASRPDQRRVHRSGAIRFSDMGDLSPIPTSSGVSEGDAAAFDDLIVTLYDELRRMARGYLRGEAAPRTLDTTALVHEAYLRLG